MPLPALSFQNYSPIQGSWGLGREATESISHTLFLFVQTEIKKKMQKPSPALSNLAGNLHDDHWEPWKLRDSWMGPLSDFPTELKGLSRETQRTSGQTSPALP